MATAVVWISIEAVVFWLNKPKPHGTLTILGENEMADVGKPFLFTVVAKNNDTPPVVVPDTGITVTSDNGSATVNADGTGGTCTPVKGGPMTLSAKDAMGLTAVLVVQVTNTVPATLEIVAAPVGPT